MIVYIYNPTSNRMERYTRGLSDEMPYTQGRVLTVREFRGSTQGSILWSDRRTMELFTQFRRYYGRPIYVGYAFKRIWEGGHTGQSQHYAGMAFDVAQNLTQQGRRRLYNSAVSFGRWAFVEPLNLTPSWVHLDDRLSPPACSSGGFIMLRRGDKGVYVLVLQDALNALNYSTGGLDGIFGPATEQGVRRFQRQNGLAADGVVGCATWRSLTSKAVGIGRTPGVID